MAKAGPPKPITTPTRKTTRQPVGRGRAGGGGAPTARERRERAERERQQQAPIEKQTQVKVTPPSPIRAPAIQRQVARLGQKKTAAITTRKIIDIPASKERIPSKQPGQPIEVEARFRTPKSVARATVRDFVEAQSRFLKGKPLTDFEVKTRDVIGGRVRPKLSPELKQRGITRPAEVSLDTLPPSRQSSVEELAKAGFKFIGGESMKQPEVQALGFTPATPSAVGKRPDLSRVRDFKVEQPDFLAGPGFELKKEPAAKRPPFLELVAAQKERPPTAQVVEGPTKFQAKEPIGRFLQKTGLVKETGLPRETRIPLPSELAVRSLGLGRQAAMKAPVSKGRTFTELLGEFEEKQFQRFTSEQFVTSRDGKELSRLLSSSPSVKQIPQPDTNGDQEQVPPQDKLLVVRHSRQEKTSGFIKVPSFLRKSTFLLSGSAARATKESIDRPGQFVVGAAVLGVGAGFAGKATVSAGKTLLPAVFGKKAAQVAAQRLGVGGALGSTVFTSAQTAPPEKRTFIIAGDIGLLATGAGLAKVIPGIKKAPGKIREGIHQAQLRKAQAQPDIFKPILIPREPTRGFPVFEPQRLVSRAIGRTERQTIREIVGGEIDLTPTARRRVRKGVRKEFVEQVRAQRPPIQQTFAKVSPQERTVLDIISGKVELTPTARSGIRKRVRKVFTRRAQAQIQRRTIIPLEAPPRTPREQTVIDLVRGRAQIRPETPARIKRAARKEFARRGARDVDPIESAIERFKREARLPKPPTPKQQTIADITGGVTQLTPRSPARIRRAARKEFDKRLKVRRKDLLFDPDRLPIETFSIKRMSTTFRDIYGVSKPKRTPPKPRPPKPTERVTRSGLVVLEKPKAPVRKAVPTPQKRTQRTKQKVVQTQSILQQRKAAQRQQRFFEEQARAQRKVSASRTRQALRPVLATQQKAAQKQKKKERELLGALSGQRLRQKSALREALKPKTKLGEKERLKPKIPTPQITRRVFARKPARPVRPIPPPKKPPRRPPRDIERPRPRETPLFLQEKKKKKKKRKSSRQRRFKTFTRTFPVPTVREFLGGRKV